MSKKEEDFEEKIIDLGGHKAKITLKDPRAIKKQDKLNAMRIALTYVEGQQMEASPKKVTEIADEFHKWLEK